MRKSLMLTSVASALSMVLGGAAFAAGHVPSTGGWSVANGTITKSTTVCSGAEYNCETVAAGPGFLQLNISRSATATAANPLKAGESFVQTIVTDQTASGASGSLGFQDVSFIKMSVSQGGEQSNVQSGIYGEQQITEGRTAAGPTTVRPVGAPVAGSELFTSDTTIASGWGLNPAGANAITIVQGITNMGASNTIQGDDFIAGFSYKATNDDKGVRNGMFMDISQSAGLKSPNSTATQSDKDSQAFALRERSGTFNTAAGAAPALGGTAAVSWVAKDDVKAIWIGQSVNLDTVLATNGLGSSFGYMSFENVTSAATTGKFASEFGFGTLNASKAWAWPTSSLLGAEPTILVP